MRLAPTPVTAALSGTFSGLAWPLLRPVFSGTDSLSTLWLVLGTIVLVALPAHAFVVGFERRQTAGAEATDGALLVRVGAWLLCAVITAVMISIYGGPA